MDCGEIMQFNIVFESSKIVFFRYLLESQVARSFVMAVLLYAIAAISVFVVGKVAAEVFVPAKKQSYIGQHVVITGGSQGMGKAVARQFVERGADVTIIARTQATLDTALAELKSIANGDQTIQALSVDCTDSDAVVRAIERIGTPDLLFCCAGIILLSGSISLVAN